MTDGEMNTLAARGLEELWPASKTICQKIMWSQFLPNMSCLQNNQSENYVEPVPAKSELPPKTIRQKIMWSQFPPNLSWFLILYCASLSCFSKISRRFCASGNWWIIVVLLQQNSLTIAIVSQKYRELLQPYRNDRFSKNIENFLCR